MVLIILSKDFLYNLKLSCFNFQPRILEKVMLQNAQRIFSVSILLV